MGLRRQILFVGDVVMSGSGGSPAATGTGGSRAFVLNQKTSFGMPYRTGGSTNASMPGGENLFVGSNAANFYFDALNALQVRDGVQWSWDTIICIGGHWDSYDLGAGGAPALATTRARATTLLDTFRSQNANCRVFWCNCIPHTNVAVNNAINNQNAAIAADIAVRPDAALITIVDINTPYAANVNYATDWGLFNTVNVYGHALAIAPTIVAALTAAGY